MITRTQKIVELLKSCEVIFDQDKNECKLLFDDIGFWMTTWGVEYDMDGKWMKDTRVMYSELDTATILGNRIQFCPFCWVSLYQPLPIKI